MNPFAALWLHVPVLCWIAYGISAAALISSTRVYLLARHWRRDARRVRAMLRRLETAPPVQLELIASVLDQLEQLPPDVDRIDRVEVFRTPRGPDANS